MEISESKGYRVKTLGMQGEMDGQNLKNLPTCFVHINPDFCQLGDISVLDKLCLLHNRYSIILTGMRNE